MATVQLRLRGGPCDAETVTIDVPDVSNPPELYDAHAHGPHEAIRHCPYRRVGQESGAGAEAEAVWIYTSCES
jgi:hypothetical protein